MIPAMPRKSFTVRPILVLVFAAAASLASAQVPSPESFFGFRMGADGKLAPWKDIQRYFETIAAASDRVDLVEIGPTTDGNRLFAAVVSAPENLKNLAAIQAANRRLADPRTLAEAEAASILSTHKAVVAIGASIHATEVGATQAANELLYTLATATDPRAIAVLQNVVLLLIPSLNPDGHTIVVDWWDKVRGTPFEGAAMPWLYHKYVGHDINRDAFMMNMAENRSLARFFYRDWQPQVFLTMHQMGERGPRFFVPPNYEPIDPNYDPIIWREAGLLGHAMALALEQDNRSGVVQNALYDYYWPGYEDSAPIGHNTVCLLTEVASVRLASPLNIPVAELSGSPRGLPEYRRQSNFPNPWPGGVWRLRDIVEYDLVAARGLLEAAARYRDDLVRNFYEMAKRAVERGHAGGPYAFLMPPDQHDPHAAARLVQLLVDAAVEVHRALEPFRADGLDYPAGTTLVLMEQPFRAYAKTLLERQDYPVRRLAPNGPPERPYDVAGWTLPDQMGVKTITVERWFEVPTMEKLDRATVAAEQVWGDRRPDYYVIDGRGNGAAIAINRLRAAGLAPSWALSPLDVQGYRYAAGSVIVKQTNDARSLVERLARELGLRATGVKGKLPANLLPVGGARVGLYKPWVASIDEGWTRWLLERYEFSFATLTDADIRAGRLRDRYDAIIVPDMPPERIVAGNRPGSVPPEYAGGLGDEGLQALHEFIDAGGTLVCLDSAGGLAIDLLKLPVKDVARDARPEQFFCPGSILSLQLDPSQPLAFGMEPQTAAFFAYSAAYDVSAAAPTDGHAGDGAALPIQVVGRYASKDLLKSGWLEGGETIAGRAAVLEARAGQGRAVLIGFRAQHRAQAHATFRLLFNAMLTAGGPGPLHAKAEAGRHN